MESDLLKPKSNSIPIKPCEKCGSTKPCQTTTTEDLARKAGTIRICDCNSIFHICDGIKLVILLLSIIRVPMKNTENVDYPFCYDLYQFFMQWNKNLQSPPILRSLVGLQIWVC